jgi:hypothetical protein
MSDKSIPEIQAEHGAKASETLVGYQDALQEIREIREPDEAGAAADYLSPDGRMRLLTDQKVERAEDLHARTLEEYTTEVERYHEALSERTQSLKERLFGITGPDGAAALSRTVTASEGELEAYLDVAIQAGNRDLARAVFMAAERRGSGDLMARYFDEVDSEARELYAEWWPSGGRARLRRSSNASGRTCPPWCRAPTRTGSCRRRG